MDFSTGWNGFSATKGIWVKTSNMDRSRGFRGKSAVFDGNAKMEIPRFTNSYGIFKEMGISFWMKRTGDSDETQGLVDNSNCKADPSIMISSKKGSVGVRFVTSHMDIVEVDGLEVRRIVLWW